MQGKRLRYIWSTAALERHQSPAFATEAQKKEDDPDARRESSPSQLTLTKALAVNPYGSSALPPG